MANTTIKQITVGSTTYDLSAKYVLDAEGHEMSWQDIVDLVETSFELVPLAELPAIPTSSQSDKDEFYAEWRNKIVAIPNSGSAPNTRDEYVLVKSGTSPNWNYSWELFGSTAVDISGKVDKGTYTTGTPSSDATGSAGAQEITTSNAGAQTASGTATITYDKATGTGNAGGVTINGSNFTFTGTAETLSQEIDYTPEGSVSVNAVGTHSHTINVSSLTASDKANVVTGISEVQLGTETTFAKNGIKAVELKTATGFATVFNTDAIKSASLKTSSGFATVFNTDAIKSASLNYGTTATANYMQFVSEVSPTTLEGQTSFLTGVQTTGSKTVITSVTYQTTSVMQNASVDANGVLSFGTTTVATSASGTTSTLPTGVSGTTGTVSINSGTVTKNYATISTANASTSQVGITTTAASTSQVGITTTDADKGTVTISGGTITGTVSVIKNLPTMTISQVNASAISGTFTGTSATIEVSINYTPQGTIGGSQTVAAHSHSVTNASTTVTGTAAVAVSSHTHNVSVASHTHSLGNHTHDISLQTPNA